AGAAAGAGQDEQAFVPAEPVAQASDGGRVRKREFGGCGHAAMLPEREAVAWDAAIPAGFRRGGSAALGDWRRPDGPRRDRRAFSANVPRPAPSAQASSLISLRRPTGRDEARLRREEGLGSGWKGSDLDGGKDSEPGPDHWAGDVLRAAALGASRRPDGP